MKDNKKLSEALWSDCETDEERFNFLQSGRAWKTGIIAKAIQHEVAMAFHFRSEIMKERRSPNKGTQPDAKDSAGYAQH